METSKTDQAVHPNQGVASVPPYAEGVAGADGESLVPLTAAEYFHSGLWLFDSLSVPVQTTTKVD